jgi:hypothetical protein
MTRLSIELVALVAVAALACDRTDAEPPGRPDAAGSPADAGADAAGYVDADPASCDPSQTSNPVADRPIRPGDYCDDVSLCAADATAAAAIMAVAPGLSCGGSGGGCAAGEVYCIWYDADEIDADDWAAICAITVMDDPPLVSCWLYL